MTDTSRKKLIDILLHEVVEEIWVVVLLEVMEILREILNWINCTRWSRWISGPVIEKIGFLLYSTAQDSVGYYENKGRDELMKTFELWN